MAGSESRLAISDLKEAFRESKPLSHDLVRALATIGQVEDLADLLGRHDDMDTWMQNEILQAAGEIVSRTRPRSLRRAVAALSTRHREILRPLIAGKAASERPQSPAARRPESS